MPVGGNVEPRVLTPTYTAQRACTTLRRCRTVGMPQLTGRILVTGPSASGKSTLARYFRARGVNAVDGDELRGLGRAVDLEGRPLRRITKDQWRRIEDWRFSWDEATLRRFLARNPNVVLFGAADDLFELDLVRLFDRRFYLDASWSVIRARLNSPARDNDWGRDDHPAQREWVRKAVREWPGRAKARGFEFLDATLPPATILARVRESKPPRGLYVRSTQSS